MKIAIIYGHPIQDSYCSQLAEAYAEGALNKGAEIRKLQLSKMEFHPVLKHGYKKRMEEESDLIWAKDSLKWADHWVIVYPVWWGTMPSLLKGFFDRVLTPGFAFQYIEGSYFHKKFFKGKTARVIATSDAPTWYTSIVYRNITKVQIKQTILGFCGISPVKFTQFGNVKRQKRTRLSKWLKKTYQLGYALN